MTDIVIGSGPSGFAAISALLARGRKVTVVDVGRERGPRSEALRAGLTEGDEGRLRSEEVIRLKSAQRGLSGDIGRFGSAFAVRPMADVVAETSGEVVLRSSNARGGLSDVWGSAVMPWSPDDMVGWPVGAADLAPHYRAVSRIMPIAGAPAPLDEMFGQPDLAFSDPLPPPPQASRLLTRLSRIEETSAVAEIRAAPARQAVSTGCRSCGLCLDGCPYGLVFSAAQPLEDLRGQGKIDYVKAEVVGLEENGDHVKVLFRDGVEPLQAARVFVAAGVLETARIVFSSRPEIAARGVTMRESRHFFIPFLHAGRAPRPDRVPHHTLVQAFLDCRVPDLSPWLIHAQFYGWNDAYARDMKQNFGFGLKALGPLFDWLSYRLFVAQTFLHSDHCQGIRLSPAGDQERRLKAEVLPEPGFDEMVNRTRAFLAQRLKRGGLHAVSRASRLEPPGASFHTGATFPMSHDPKLGGTDVLGRLSGQSRVHIVDASVMPAIPASTITLSVMANAHRIASLA